MDPEGPSAGIILPGDRIVAVSRRRLSYIEVQPCLVLVTVLI